MKLVKCKSVMMRMMKHVGAREFSCDERLLYSAATRSKRRHGGTLAADTSAHQLLCHYAHWRHLWCQVRLHYCGFYALICWLAFHLQHWFDGFCFLLNIVLYCS